MESLTIAHVNQFLENDLAPLMDRLEAEMSPLWGKMSPQHMVEHLAWSLQMSNGKENLPIKNPEEHLPKLQRYLYNLWASPKLFKSPVMDKEKLPTLKLKDLNVAKVHFWKEWTDFEIYFNKNKEATTPNPVFGYLTEEQWRRFHFKHFVHHLCQFGIITCEDFGLKPSVY